MDPVMIIVLGIFAISGIFMVKEIARKIKLKADGDRVDGLIIDFEIRYDKSNNDNIRNKRYYYFTVKYEHLGVEHLEVVKLEDRDVNNFFPNIDPRTPAKYVDSFEEVSMGDITNAFKEIGKQAFSSKNYDANRTSAEILSNIPPQIIPLIVDTKKSSNIMINHDRLQNEFEDRIGVPRN